jgi:hypothetical protein
MPITLPARGLFWRKVSWAAVAEGLAEDDEPAASAAGVPDATTI